LGQHSPIASLGNLQRTVIFTECYKYSLAVKHQQIRSFLRMYYATAMASILSWYLSGLVYYW